MNNKEVIQHLITSRKKYLEILTFSKLPGIYAVFFCGEHFPIENIKPTLDEVIYLGKTESSQENRNAKTHFRSGKTGSSTLRKSIGSLLRNKYNLKPIVRNDSDVIKRRFSHFKFDNKSEEIITEWMKNNLSLSFYEYPNSTRKIETLETELIQELIPLLNIDKNPSNPHLNLLKQIRKESAQIAFKDFKISEKNVSSKIEKVTKMSTGSENKYTTLWQGYINKINSSLLQSDKPQSIQLDSKLFSQVGNRKSYAFNLEYKNGIVNNNIGGSAVARDLDKVISKSQAIKNTLKDGNYKINLDKEFVLHIKKL